MRKLLGRLYVWVRFGKIKSRSVEFLNGHEAEIEYYNAKGCVVEYWAYGYYDPRLPYRGQDE